MAVAAPEMLRAAHVRRPHGVRGALAVTPLGGDARRFTAGVELTDERTGAQYVVQKAVDSGDGDVILYLRDVADRAAADGLRGAYLSVPAQAARRLGDDEWFVWQLIGLAVVDAADNPLGVVVDVEEQPAHDLLVVENGQERHLYPMVSAFVESVDIDARRIVVTPWQWVQD